MKLILLLPLLLALPKPIFAGSSTDGYKKEKSCISTSTREFKPSLWKKENSNSKKWGSYVCKYRNYTITNKSYDCIGKKKGVSYDEANGYYEKLCG